MSRHKIPKHKKKIPTFICILVFQHGSTSEMTFEEKLEALMKNYQVVSSSKAELGKQNEYLQKQLGNDMK